MTLPILENLQFGRVSGCCYGYCDKFCAWCIKLSALTGPPPTDRLLTKDTNVAHAPHHPENLLKFTQIHSKRGNMRNGGCSAGIVNIHRMFPKGRHTMNAKMRSHLKDVGITLYL